MNYLQVRDPNCCENTLVGMLVLGGTAAVDRGSVRKRNNPYRCSIPPPSYVGS